MISGVILPLLAGLAIFLFGMKIMELALHQWAGPYLKAFLQRLTRTPWRGLLTGAGLTTIAQSSSAITVITIGLVNARILTFSQTMGIVLGTNIGTCITAELISLPIHHLAMPTLLISFTLWLGSWIIPRRIMNSATAHLQFIRIIRCISLAAGGFSCLLLGMEVMQAIVPTLQSEGLIAWFLHLSQRNLLWAILAGTCLTAIIQSSTATVAITMGLVAAHAISVQLGIAIIIGANIGTCSTALIASIGGSKNGQYVAWFHVLLNAGGALLFIPLISSLHAVSAWLTTDLPSQIAHAQTLFNVVCSLIALPLCYLPSFILSRRSR